MIAYSYLLKVKQQPMCHACQITYTIEHVLIEWIDPAKTRETFYNTNFMKELFFKNKVGAKISLLEAVDIYGKRPDQLKYKHYESI